MSIVEEETDVRQDKASLMEGLVKQGTSNGSEHGGGFMSRTKRFQKTYSVVAIQRIAASCYVPVSIMYPSKPAMSDVALFGEVMKAYRTAYHVAFCEAIAGSPWYKMLLPILELLKEKN